MALPRSGRCRPMWSPAPAFQLKAPAFSYLGLRFRISFVEHSKLRKPGSWLEGQSKAVLQVLVVNIWYGMLLQSYRPGNFSRVAMYPLL
jgi:hypothetical protein